MTMAKRWSDPYAPLQSSLLIEGPSTPPDICLYPINASSRPHSHPSLSRAIALPSPPLSPLSRNKRSTHLSLPAQPSTPLPWLWQCHHCRHTYPLGATRRCLDDGHTFCSGEAHTTKNVCDQQARRYMKKTKACASEFDYEGWRVWGAWKAQVSPRRASSVHDCWKDCRYPSDCKWSAKAQSNREEEETAIDEMEVAEAVAISYQQLPKLGVKRATSLAAMDLDEGYATDEERMEMDVDKQERVEGLSGRFGMFEL